jgi:hypothetical protein
VAADSGVPVAASPAAAIAPEATDTPRGITARASKLSRTVKLDRSETAPILGGRGASHRHSRLLSVAVRVAGETRNRKEPSDETFYRCTAPRTHRER